MSANYHLDLTALLAMLLGAGAAACAPQSPAADFAADMQPVPVSSSARALPCPAITEDVAEQGRKLFSGSGNCYTCHGNKAKGTPLAPDLTDQKWLQIDGSFPAIVKLIETGVPSPKEHPAPMPPKGGAKLNDAQVCALGAYIFTLTHPLSK